MPRTAYGRLLCGAVATRCDTTLTTAVVRAALHINTRQPNSGCGSSHAIGAVERKGSPQPQIPRKARCVSGNCREAAEEAA